MLSWVFESEDIKCDSNTEILSALNQFQFTLGH